MDSKNIPSWPLKVQLHSSRNSSDNLTDYYLENEGRSSLIFHNVFELCRWLQNEFCSVSPGWVVEPGIEQVVASSYEGCYERFAVGFDEIASTEFSASVVLERESRKVELSLQYFNPPWIFSPDDHWISALDSLSKRQIEGLSHRLDLQTSPTMTRFEHLAMVLPYVRAFVCALAEKTDASLALLCMVFSNQRQSTDLLAPFLKSRQTMLAYICSQYFGTEVASALRVPYTCGYLSHISTYMADRSSFVTMSSGVCSSSLLSLLRRLPKTVLKESLRHIHPSRRIEAVYVNEQCVIDDADLLMRSIVNRCAEFDELSNIAIKEVLGCLEPFSTCMPTVCRMDYVFRILYHEYGQAVIECLVTAKNVLNERNERIRAARSMKRVDDAAHLKGSVRACEREWPQVVSDEVVHACLNDYMDSMTWHEPLVCASCSRSKATLKYTEVAAGDGLFEKLNLDVLHVYNPELANVMQVSGDAKYWKYRELNRVMLDGRGVVDSEGGSFVLHLCDECIGTLKKNKIPRLSLANNLYRGRLPDEFNDLTWVEEMMCARYLSTAVIARLDLGHDKYPGRILRGNTCAHEMNTLSTAQVLPRTPDNINGLISVVFLGPILPSERDLEEPFYVRRDKVWRFLQWLKENNELYMDLALDPEVMKLYPSEGILPGLMNRIIHHEISAEDARDIYEEETAGISGHPSNELHGPRSDPTKQGVFLDRTGVSDASLSGLPGRFSISAAMRNIIPHKSDQEKSIFPDLMIHRRASALGEYNNPTLFPGMYPTLFPYGIGGFEEYNRPTRLSFESQAKYFLDIRDRQFRYHVSFIFVVLNIIQRRTGHLYTSFSVSKGSFQQIANCLNGLSAKTLDKLAATIEAEGNLKNLSEEEKTAMTLLRYVNTIATKVPGSAASKTLCRNEIRSYVGVMGVPQIFFTINPTPQHHPLFQLMVGDLTVDLSQRYPVLAPGPERAERLANDPVAAADFFDKSIRCVFEHLFGWDYDRCQSSDRGGILGHIEGFYGTSEYTERGVLHGHFLIWLSGGLNPTEVHQRMKDDKEFESRFFKFFEDVIRHELPNVDLPSGFDRNTYKPGVEMPPPPLPCPEAGSTWAKETKDRWQDVFQSEVKLCGEALQRHPKECRPVCKKYGSKKCRFRFPHDIVEESRFDVESNSILLACRDSMVNYYNPYILVYCRHNHDIKCILSGKSAKAAMFYITDYITKMSLKTGQLLSLMCKAVMTASSHSVENETPVESAKRLLHKCLAQFSKKQSIHAQQAARYLRGSRDSISSHKTIAVLSNLVYSHVKEIYQKARGREIEVIPSQTESNENEADGNGREDVDSDPSAGVLLGPDFQDGAVDRDMTVVADSNASGSNITPQDTGVEHDSVVMRVTDDGRLIDSTQLHDYLYRDDKLSHLSFMDFVCMYTLEKKKEIRRPDRAGVKARFDLKAEHPLSSSHCIVERFVIDGNAPRKIYAIPRIVGMSIPRARQGEEYSLFLFGHFVPFDAQTNPLRDTMDVNQFISEYEFSPEDQTQMRNWEVIYECEDARDADRLAEQEKLMREARGLRAATSTEGDDIGSGVEIPSVAQPKTLPQTLKHVSLIRKLQYSGYLAPGKISDHIYFPDRQPVQNESWISSMIAEWDREIKRERAKIALEMDRHLHVRDQLRNNGSLNPEIGLIPAPTELGSGLTVTFVPVDETIGQQAEVRQRSSVPSYIPILKTKTGPRTGDTVGETPAQVIHRIRVENNLNRKQGIAFEIAALSWMKIFVRRIAEKNNVVLVEKPEEPLRLLMTGPGGTGKSHAIRALKQFMETYESGHRLRLLAPTGSAASLIGGMTCHKGLSLKVKQKSDRGVRVQRTSMEEAYDMGDSVKTKSKMRRSWEHIDVVLIDEVSLLSLINLAEIDYALRMAKERPNEWFGGIIIIFAGDFCQFPPVGGNALYSCMRSNRELSDKEIKRRLGRLAWKTLNAVVEFEEQFRMKDDPGYSAAVNRLRERSCTLEDVDLFNSRVIKTMKNPNGPDMAFEKNGEAVMIVSRNDIREEVNAYKAETQSSLDESKRLFRCGALDYIGNDLVPNLDHANCRDIALSLETAPFANDGALPGFIPLYEGMPVILRGQNIAVELRIANGSQGYVHKVETAVDRYGIMYAKMALVQFPDSPIQLSGLPQGVYPIKPVTCRFTTTLEIEPGNPLRYKIVRYQLPIQPGFCVTGQSAQGKTMAMILGDIREGAFAAYVTVSRARRREDLFLLNPVRLEDLNIKRSVDLESELRRYAAMERNTLIRFGFEAGELLTIPDAEDQHFEPQSRIFSKSSNSLIWNNIVSEEQDNTLVPMDCPAIPSDTISAVGSQCRTKGKVMDETAKVSEKDVNNSVVEHTASKPTDFSRTVATTGHNRLVSSIGSLASCCGEKRKRCRDIDDDLPVRKYRRLNFKTFPGCKWDITWSCAYDCVFMAFYTIFRKATVDWRLDWSLSTPCTTSLAAKFDRLLQLRGSPEEVQLISDMRDEFRAFMSKVDSKSFPRSIPTAVSVYDLLSVALRWNRRTLQLSLRQGQPRPDQQQINLSRDGLQQDLYDRRDHELPFCKRHTHQCWMFSACTLDKEQIWRPQHDQLCIRGDSTPFVMSNPPSILALCHTPTMGDSVLPVRILQVPSQTGRIQYFLASIIYWGGNHFTSRIFEGGYTYAYDGQKFLGDCIREDENKLSELFPEDFARFTTLNGRSAYLFLYARY